MLTKIKSFNMNLEQNNSSLTDIWTYIKTNKINNILIIRFVAAILVALFHAFKWIHTILPSNTMGFDIDTYLLIVVTPCVDIFLLCTGFISFNKKKQNWKKYFMLLLIFYVFNFFYELKNIVNHNVNHGSLFMPIIFAGGNLWFLKVYFVFTPLVPYLNKMIQKKKDAFFFIIFLIILFLLQYIPTNYDWWISSIFSLNSGVSLVQFIALYLLGRSIIFFIPCKKNNKWFIGVILYIVSMILSVILYLFIQKTLPLYNSFQIVLMAVSICLVVLMINLPNNKLTKYMVKLGQLSLYFYMLNIFSMFYYIVPVRNWFFSQIGNSGAYFLCTFFEIVWYILIFSIYLLAKQKIKKSYSIYSTKKEHKKEIELLNEFFGNLINNQELEIVFYIYKIGTIDSKLKNRLFTKNNLYSLLQKNIIVYNNNKFNIKPNLYYSIDELYKLNNMCP